MTRRKSFLKKLSISDRVAILALIFSVASIFVSIWTAMEQKREWRATSLGRVDVTSAKFIYWRTLSEEEMNQMKWGYNVNLMPLLEDNKVSRLYGLPSRLIAFDSQSGRPYPDISALTRDEIEAKIKNAPALPSTVIPAKQFQLEFDFQNVGSTDVIGLKIAVDGKLPDTSQWQEDSWSQPVDLAPNRPIFKLKELNAPIDAFLPDKLSFRLRLQYVDAEGEQISRVIPVYFQSQTGSFNFGE